MHGFITINWNLMLYENGPTAETKFLKVKFINMRKIILFNFYPLLPAEFLLFHTDNGQSFFNKTYIGHHMANIYLYIVRIEIFRSSLHVLNVLTVCFLFIV